MGTRDPRVDAYIAKSADFAKPILNRLRKLVHTGCPDVEETMKWSFPHFMYKGMLCSMAAFKAHCALSFWKGDLVLDGKAVRNGDGEDAMGQFGRITAMSDLPSDSALTASIRKAATLNDDGVKVVKPKRTEKKELTTPPDLAAALKKNRAAQKTFDSFSYSHKKEYVEWITEAKRDETRRKRLATAVEWMAQGKPRNWKYTNC